MEKVFEIRNGAVDELEVWLEPWCHPYKVPRGSVLRLTYAAAAAGRIDTALTPERLVVWTNSDHAPDAQLDGRRVSPDFAWPRLQGDSH